MPGIPDAASERAVGLPDLASQQKRTHHGDRVDLLEEFHRGKEGENVKSDGSKGHEPEAPSLAWKTILAIVGCYILALLIFIAHYCLFRLLDGQDSSGTSTLSQSWVTTISLLLVTAFRASLLVALGMSFAQTLWSLLRTKALPVSLIESLFRLRRNIFELASPKIALRAPTLLLAAVVYWAVSIAIIYPPGALIVQLEQFSYVTAVNASVMNPRPDMKIRDENWPSLHGLAEIWAVTSTFFEFPIGHGATGNFSDHYYYRSPTTKLQRLAKLVMFNGEIASLDPLGSVNSSYSLKFQGPQVRCRRLPRTNSTIDVQGNAIHHEIVFNTTWSDASEFQLSPIQIAVSTSQAKGYFLAVNQSSPVELRGSERDQGRFRDNRTMSVIFETRVLQCDAYLAIYSVDISYEKGVQVITYNVSASGELRFQKDRRLPIMLKHIQGVEHTNQDFLDWSTDVLDWNYVANSYAILDAVGQTLPYIWRLHFETYELQNNVTGTFHLPDGREVNIADVYSFVGPGYTNNYTILEDTILNTERYKRYKFSRVSQFDPREALDLSEDSINELLANVSISALSLREWYANVAVNNTENKAVYRFHQPLNLILPYGLCLAATLIFVIIGLHALMLNGVPATDGGFLQILMTTTGDTALNKAAAKGSLCAVDAAPKELLDMKVRFANLNEGSAVRAGFGTIEETTAFQRKGWRTKN